MKKKLTLFFLLLITLAGFSQTSRDISNIFSKTEHINERSLSSIKNPVFLDLNVSKLKQIYQQNNYVINLTLPLSEHENIKLNLHQFKVLSDHFILRTSSGDTIRDYKPGLFYTGEIEGKKGVVTISVFENQVIGIISIEGEGNYNLGNVEGSDNLYIIFNDKNFKEKKSFECHTPDPQFGLIDQHQHQNINSRSGDCVKFYIEGDYELYQAKGGTTGATNYITSLFAEVAELYAIEQISIEISETMVWNTPDNYPNSDSGADLDQFQTNNPTFNGNVASLYSLGGSNEGGLAYVDVLCEPGYAYGFMGIEGNFNQQPTFSWDVEVVAHEMGHNFGSQHTHACVWNGNNTQIDDCGNKYSYDNGETPEGNACFNPNNPILPADGTIMSYCHLLSVGINLALGFGPQPGNLIRSKYNNASCLTACGGSSGNPPEASFISDIVDVCEGGYVNFTDNSTNNPTTWSWTFPGGLPSTSTEQNPTIQYSEPGNYNVTLVAGNSYGSNTKLLQNYITVHAAPVPSFTYTITNNNQVQFFNNSTNSNSFYWDFDDGSESYEENPTHTFTNDGIFTVILYASNDYCSDQIEYSQNINIVTPVTAGFHFTQTDFCNPVSIQFYDNSSSNVTSRLWTFQGGTPSTSTAQNPIVTYQTVGFYDVTLVVNNSQFNNTKFLNDTVKIYTNPTSNFSTVVNGNNVSFTNTSTGATSYFWEFGDGTTSVEANPVHIYQNSGTYNVTLTSTNICGQTQKTSSVIITLQPVANFNAGITSGCSPFSVTFNNLSNTNNIAWTFEGGVPSTSTSLNPVVNYLSAGTFDVQLIATNSLGKDTLLLENYITVLGQPIGDFNYNVNSYTVNFTQATSNVTSFSWNFGDGSQSTTSNPQHIYQQDGVYTVIFTYSNICDTLTVSKQVTILHPPVAGFSYNNVSGCHPLVVNYTNQSSSNATQLNWTFVGGNPSTSTATNPIVTYTTPGIYNVSLVASNSAGNNTYAVQNLVHVYSFPEANFSSTANGLNYSFTYSGSDATSIKWLFGDGSNAVGSQVQHTYLQSGTYTLKVIAQNPCGIDTLTTSLNVALNAVAQFINTTPTGCAPLTVQFTNTSTLANSILWNFEGGVPSFSTESNPIVIYSVDGTFDVRLIAFGTNGNDTINRENLISVDGGPEVQFNFTTNDNLVHFINNTSSDADEYYWDFGDGTVSTEKNPIHVYNTIGTYIVTLFASSECGQHSLNKNVVITTVGTNDLVSEKVSLFPNPNDGNMTLFYNSDINENCNISIYNTTGIKVFNYFKDLHSGENYINCNISDKPDGMYYLKLTSKNSTKNLTFIKQ